MAEGLCVVDTAIEDLVEDVVGSLVDLIDLVLVVAAAAANIAGAVMRCARCGDDPQARHG